MDIFNYSSEAFFLSRRLSVEQGAWKERLEKESPRTIWIVVTAKPPIATKLKNQELKCSFLPSTVEMSIENRIMVERKLKTKLTNWNQVLLTGSRKLIPRLWRSVSCSANQFSQIDSKSKHPLHEWNKLTAIKISLVRLWRGWSPDVSSTLGRRSTVAPTLLALEESTSARNLIVRNTI